MSGENPVCPCCGQQLIYRDRRPRIMKHYEGKKYTILIRRLKCLTCGHLHNELPDCLVPHKHFSAEVIENVTDGVSTPDDVTTESSPCEKTMQRWKNWISSNTAHIDGYLRSIGSRLPGVGTELLTSTGSLLSSLRLDGAGWLGIITRALYNTGGILFPVPPEEKYAPALSRCPSPP